MLKDTATNIAKIARSHDTKLAVSRGTSFEMICYIAGNFEAGNSLNLALTAVIGQQSEVTVHCYPLTSDFVMLPAQRF